jgi:hypothetical protein
MLHTLSTFLIQTAGFSFCCAVHVVTLGNCLKYHKICAVHVAPYVDTGIPKY